ncbi:MAG: polysaccharide pyruvyl transferase family protein [Paludibacteraceae bacterium]
MSIQKKISLITIIDNTNFGTYLQATALGLVLKSKGFYVEIVNYQRPHLTTSYNVKEAVKKGLLKSVYNILYRIPRVAYQKKKCRDFVLRYVPFSPTKYTNYEELVKQSPEADIYMTGSDQVWNSIYNKGIDKSYYLDFAPENKLRVAYAASVGMPSFPKDEVSETKALLRKYNSISVREFDVKQLLLNIGIANVEVVLDPTLLLNGRDWTKLIRNIKKPAEEYLLIYTVETKKESKIIELVAKEIARKKKLKIYAVSYSGRAYGLRFCDKIFYRAAPDTFLNLMYHTQYVVVSSFHGTAFAINMNKQFFSIIPNRFNTRVKNLLDLCGLENRLIENEEFSIEKSGTIDFDKVNQILSSEREKALDYIDRIIKQ